MMVRLVRVIVQCPNADDDLGGADGTEWLGGGLRGDVPASAKIIYAAAPSLLITAEGNPSAK